MSLNARDVTLPGLWALTASTNPPATPVQGVSYRDPNPSKTDFETGQQYYEVYDSARLNALYYALSVLCKEAEQYGFVRWSPETDYTGEVSIVMGTDGVPYRAIQNSGPNWGGAKNPVSESSFWETLATYILSSGGGGGGDSVPISRKIDTIAPLTGGGDLSIDRTFSISSATSAAQGVIELATQSEVNTGTDTTRAVTPATLQGKVSGLAPRPIKTTGIGQIVYLQYGANLPAGGTWLWWILAWNSTSSVDHGTILGNVSAGGTAVTVANSLLGVWPHQAQNNDNGGIAWRIA